MTTRCCHCNVALSSVLDPLYASFGECEACFWRRPIAAAAVAAAAAATSEATSEEDPAANEETATLHSLTDDCLLRVMRGYLESTPKHFFGCKCHLHMATVKDAQVRADADARQQIIRDKCSLVQADSVCNGARRSAFERGAQHLAVVCSSFRRVVKTLLVPELRLEGLREISSTAEALQQLTMGTSRFLHDCLAAQASSSSSRGSSSGSKAGRGGRRPLERPVFAPAGVDAVALGGRHMRVASLYAAAAPQDNRGRSHTYLTGAPTS